MSCPNQNNCVFLPLINVETHVLVRVRVGAVIHVLVSVIWTITTHPECYCLLGKVLAFRYGVDAHTGKSKICSMLVW